MFLEVMEYRVRPGRMPALLARFENATVALFKKHGFRAVGFYTNLIGPSNNTLTYHLEWESLDERNRCWAAFMADPDWLTALKESEKEGGPLLVDRANKILAPTSFSPKQ